jgi:hypothetical protein
VCREPLPNQIHDVERNDGQNVNCEGRLQVTAVQKRVSSAVCPAGQVWAARKFDRVREILRSFCQARFGTSRNPLQHSLFLLATETGGPSKDRKLAEEVLSSLPVKRCILESIPGDDRYLATKRRLWSFHDKLEWHVRAGLRRL